MDSDDTTTQAREALNMQRVYDMVEHHIATHGWHITAVPYERTGTLFAYTTGLTAKGHPELFIQGPVPMATLGSLLNDAGRKLCEGNLPVGRNSDLLAGDFDVLVLPMSTAACISAEMIMSTRRYEDVTGLQIVLPDADGSLPDVPTFTNECRAVMHGQIGAL